MLLLVKRQRDMLGYHALCCRLSSLGCGFSPLNKRHPLGPGDALRAPSSNFVVKRESDSKEDNNNDAVGMGDAQVRAAIVVLLIFSSLYIRM